MYLLITVLTFPTNLNDLYLYFCPKPSRCSLHERKKFFIVYAPKTVFTEFIMKRMLEKLKLEYKNSSSAEIPGLVTKKTLQWNF